MRGVQEALMRHAERVAERVLIRLVIKQGLEPDEAVTRAMEAAKLGFRRKLTEILVYGSVQTHG